VNSHLAAHPEFASTQSNHKTANSRYIKMQVLQWTAGVDLQPTNQLAMQTFADGDHYIYIDACNEGTTAVGSGEIAGAGCTKRTDPVSTNLSLLHCEPNLTAYELATPSGLDYVKFYNQKTCFDVHLTEDDGVNSWDGDKLPKNVRPNDFASQKSFIFMFDLGTINSSNGTVTSQKTNIAMINNLKYTYTDPNDMILRSAKTIRGTAC
jgi:hypothetical protein